MHYRNLVDLAKSIGPDVAQLNDLAPKMAVPRIDASITKGIIHSALEERFWGVWTSLGGPPLQREVRFHPTRRWRFDFVVDWGQDCLRGARRTALSAIGASQQEGC